MTLTYSPETVAWASKFDYCWLCGCSGAWKFGLEIHHIARGSYRNANEISTTMILCSACHRHIHSSKDAISIATMLAMKMIHDPLNYDREYVNQKRGRAKNAVTESEVACEVSRLFTNRSFPKQGA